MKQQDIPAGKPANVGDGERVLSAIAGSLLLYFVAKRHKADSLLLLGGGYLLYRAVSGHCPLVSAFKSRRGAIGERVARLLTPVFREKIEADLNNFKHYIENAGVAMD